MGSKLGGTLVALVFALPFGGVGVLASWGIAHMVRESHRAGDWVLVQAKVDDAALKASRGSKGGTTYYADGAYRYNVGGREFVSTQLGFSLAGGSDNIGDWQASMAAFLEEAKNTGKSIPVYVNPDNPAEAVVDRDIRWSMVLFMGVFAVLFGGVGVGALGAVIAIWLDKSGKSGKNRKRGKKGRADSVAAYAGERNRAAVAGAGKVADVTTEGNPAVIASGAGSSTIGLWIFTIVWNLIAFPIALLTVPDLVRTGEWVGLFVLLFPLIGVLMLWGAIAQTVSLLRRGKATLALNDAEPRMGGRLSGVVQFARAGRPGQEFEVRLLATQKSRSGDSTTVVPRWWRDVNVRAAADPRGGLRVPFQFDVPSRVSAPGVAAGDEPYALAWSVQVKPRGSSANGDEFEVRLQRSREPVDDVPAADPTPDQRRNEAVVAKIFSAEALATLTPEQRATFSQLSPDAQAVVGKLVNNAGTIRKVAAGVGIALFVLFVLAALIS